MRVVLVLSTSHRIFFESFEEAFKDLKIEMSCFWFNVEGSVSEQREELLKLIRQEHINQLLVLNDLHDGKEHLIDKEVMQTIPSFLWYLDTMRFDKLNNQDIKQYKQIYSFEPQDISYCQNRYQVTIKYLPLTAGYSLFCSQRGTQKKKIYDVSFVGMVNGLPERQAVLNLVAKHCAKKHYKLIVYGKLWHSHHFYQRLLGAIKFCLTYPDLFKFAHNKYLQPKEAAELYKQSKINLNIHIAKHSSINCRTFEILGNGNFELCDDRNLSLTELVDGQHLVLYKSGQDLLDKIDYYLESNERERIAQAGGELVNKKYLLSKTLRVIFPGTEEL